MKKIALLFSLLILNPLLAQIQLGADIDGEAAGDYSGRSVSISSDGTRVAIGAPQNEGNGSNAGMSLSCWSRSQPITMSESCAIPAEPRS